MDAVYGQSYRRVRHPTGTQLFVDPQVQNTVLYSNTSQAPEKGGSTLGFTGITYFQPADTNDESIVPPLQYPLPQRLQTLLQQPYNAPMAIQTFHHPGRTTSNSLTTPLYHAKPMGFHLLAQNFLLATMRHLLISLHKAT